VARILVVDDEPGILEFLEEELRLWGHKVEKAGNGREAIEKVRSWNPHLMLLDVRMPEMDGIETLVRLAKMNHATAIVMMTAVHEKDVAEQAMALGASDYVTKPVQLDRLRMVVETKLIEILGADV